MGALTCLFWYHDDPQLIVSMDNLIILDNVLMVALLQYGDLLVDFALVYWGLQDLDGNFLVMVEGLVDDSVSSFADYVH